MISVSFGETVPSAQIDPRMRQFIPNLEIAVNPQRNILPPPPPRPVPGSGYDRPRKDLSGTLSSVSGLWWAIGIVAATGITAYTIRRLG